MTISTSFMQRYCRQVGFLIGLAGGALAVLAGVSSSYAQSSPGAEALDMSESDSSDLFTPGGGNLRSPLDLYHRANLANTRTTAEFMEEQRSVLGTEIENLRQQQQYLLQGQPTQPQVATEEPSQSPTTPTP